MVDKIRIKNFQAHKDTELVLGDGLNAVVGVSDSGKSAIVRAISWLITNRPLGFSFHSWFTDKPTEVEMEIDGSKVKLEKDNKGAKYTLADKEWEKIGTDVPDEVVKFLNLDEINIADQKQLSYLVLDTPGNVGKEINKITKLEKVDDWVSSLTSKINGEKRDVKLLKKQSEEVEEQLKPLKHIEEIKKKVDMLLSKQDKVSALEEKSKEINNILERIYKLQESIRTAQEWVKVEGKVNKIESLCREVEEKAKLRDYLEDICTLEEKISKCKKRLKIEPEVLELDKKVNELRRLENIEVVLSDYVELLLDIKAVREFLRSESKVTKIVDKYNELKELVQEEAKIASILERVDSLESNIKESIEAIKENKIEFKELLIEVGNCPTCGSEISDKDIKRIIKEM